MVDLDTIRDVPRFAGIGPEAQQWLAQRVSRRSFPRGDTLFHEGDPCDQFLLVEHGAVKIGKFLESGRELILGFFRAGEAIGEVALIDNAGYPATARAHEDASVLVLTRSDYFDLLRRYPEVPLAIIRDLSLRMRALSRRVEDLGGGGVEFRLARVLMAMAATCGHTEGPALHIPVALTRQDLADMIGARVETVIRAMSRWQKDGLLTTQSDGFHVPDRAALEAVLSGGAG